MADLEVIKMLNITKVMVGTSPIQIKGVIGGMYGIEMQMVKGYHDGILGVAAQDRIITGLYLSLQFESNPPLAALVVLPEANVVVTYRVGGGTFRTATFKNVLFGSDRSEINWARKTEAAYGQMKIDGACTWAATDTLATMLVDAPAA